MTTYDYDQTVKLLRDAVKDRGEDFVYEVPQGLETCLNWHGNHWNGVPGCIVGYVVYRVLRDNEFPEVMSFMAKRAHCNSWNLVDSVKDQFGIKFTRPAAILLNRVQKKQDDQTPWGTAVEEAISATEGENK